MTSTWDTVVNESVKSHRLYINNTFICENLNLEEKSVSCITKLPKGEITFNMTQAYKDGTESNFSNSLTYVN